MIDRAISLALIVSAFALTPSMVACQGASTDKTVTDYFVINQDVRQVLRELERASGIRYDVSNHVRGRLQALRLVGDPAEIMETIGEQIALDWFAFNGVVHVSARSEIQTRLVRLGDIDAGIALETLGQSGLPVSTFPSQVTGDGATLALTGPPSYLALAETVLETFTPKRPAPRAAPSVRTVVVRRGTESQVVEFR